MRNYNGEFLRRAELEALGVSCGGDDVLVHTSVVIVNTEGLRIGDHVRIDPFCVLSATGGITLGSHIHISSHCTLVGGGGIEIEDYATVSHGVRIFSVCDDARGHHMINPTVPDACRGLTTAPVKLKRHCAIGSGAIILAGVTIGEGALVGIASLIRKDVPDWTAIVFTSARSTHWTREKDCLALEAKWIAPPPAADTASESGACPP
jgi:galactoside O-acetyltransferase